MGAVYLVEDQNVFGKQWALKELLGTFTNPADRAQAIRQFEQEAKLLVSLSHPNLPQVTDYFSDGGRQYLVMEYIDGKTLEAILRNTSGFLPEAQVMDWAVQICEVLEYLHSQKPNPIIFRDLKPANIMLDADDKIKLIDFGIARLFDPTKKTDTLKMGTAGYAPPEQYAGGGQTDIRSDTYALGATLHHLLTGRDPSIQPFIFPPCQKLNSQISAAVADIVQKAIELDPDRRYHSALEMKQALLHLSSTSRRSHHPVLAKDLANSGRLPSNKVLQGRYTIVNKVGQGECTTVYQAIDQRIAGRRCAIKEMSMSQLITPAARAQAGQAFRQEAALLAHLDHSNLPRLRDFFEEGGCCYMVMDFVEGQTLKEKLDGQGRRPLPEAQVLKWAKQLCDVLEYLHNQIPPIVFRDLKPANIMVTADGGVKLIDFGIARHFKPGQAQDTRRFGTKGYAPPEQHGKGQTDARSDIYSLGVTLHELLTGHDPTATPFHLPSLQQFSPTVSQKLEQIIAKMTESSNTQRYQSMAEVKWALDALW